MSNTFKLIKNIWTKWNEDETSQLSAALAYYTIFSLAPFALLIIYLVGLFLRDQNVQVQIIDFFQTSVGPDAAETIQSMIKAAERQKSALLPNLIGFFTLIFGALGVVSQLQTSFNKIWNVEVKPNAGLKTKIKKQSISLLLIGVVGVLILASLLLSTGLSLALNYLKDTFPDISYVLPLSELLISFGVLSLLFVIMFIYLPDVKLSWKHVWRGAFLSGFLFMIGKFVLAWYFSYANIASSYGTAGSFILILLWVYYSSLILLFGVQFTQVWTKLKGLKIDTKPFAHFSKSRIIINSPAALQEMKTTFKVIKTELKLWRWLNKVKNSFQKKKEK